MCIEGSQIGKLGLNAEVMSLITQASEQHAGAVADAAATGVGSEA